MSYLLKTPLLLTSLRLCCVMTLVTGLTLSGLSTPMAQAANFTVNNSADAVDAAPGNGICETAPGNQVCTLRAAIQEANALPGSDTITLPPSLYVLTRAGGDNTANNGDLDITDDLAIIGGGADTTVVDGNLLDRVFHIFSATVQINGVTIRHGNSGSASGGGLRNQGGTLTLADSAVVSNSAGGGGGGIYNTGVLTLTHSSVLSNTAETAAGGVRNAGGTLVLVNVTVSGNTAKTDGGGIRTSSTGTLLLRNVTLTNNTADYDEDGTGEGGGLYSSSASVLLQNTLVVGNFDNSAGTKRPDCSGPMVSQGYNLLGNSTGCTVSATTGDLIGTQNNPINPLLGPLQNNGGPTLTHALLPSSPAIDTGNPATPGAGGNACEATDQRGMSRPQGPACDIGAYEAAVPIVQFSLAPALAGTTGNPGATVTYTLTLTNTGNVTDTYGVTITGAVFTTTTTTTVGPLAPSQGGTFVVSVQIPPGATAGATDVATVTARSQGNNSQTATATLTTTVVFPVTGGQKIYLPLISNNP